MAPKILFLLLLASSLNLSTRAAGPKPPVIHFTNTEKSYHIELSVKARGALQASFELSPNKEYQLNADISDVYNANASNLSLEVALFRAYDPVRDQGKADIYWRADDKGFSISYDQKNWKLLAPWTVITSQ